MAENSDEILIEPNGIERRTSAWIYETLQIERPSTKAVLIADAGVEAIPSGIAEWFALERVAELTDPDTIEVKLTRPLIGAVDAEIILKLARTQFKHLKNERAIRKAYHACTSYYEHLTRLIDPVSQLTEVQEFYQQLRFPLEKIGLNYLTEPVEKHISIMKNSSKHWSNSQKGTQILYETYSEVWSEMQDLIVNYELIDLSHYLINLTFIIHHKTEDNLNKHYTSGYPMDTYYLKTDIKTLVQKSLELSGFSGLRLRLEDKFRFDNNKEPDFKTAMTFLGVSLRTYANAPESIRRNYPLRVSDILEDEERGVDEI